MLTFLTYNKNPSRVIIQGCNYCHQFYTLWEHLILHIFLVGLQAAAYIKAAAWQHLARGYSSETIGPYGIRHSSGTPKGCVVKRSEGEMLRSCFQTDRRSHRSLYALTSVIAYFFFFTYACQNIIYFYSQLNIMQD